MDLQSEKRILINKFLAGEISDSDIVSLKAWLTDRQNRKIFDEENELWQQSRIKFQNEHFIIDKAWSEISTELGIGKRKISPVLILKRNYFRIFLAAASLLCLTGIGAIILWLTHNNADKEISIVSTIIKTLEGEKTNIMLYDSTIVYLNSASSLEYSNDYNKTERKVKLTGEAFFDVYTDAKKPFTVQLDKLTVTAKGTRFNVSAYNTDNQIETTLEEGNIEVNISGEKPVGLIAGQQAVYYRKSNKSLLRNVSIETYTSWKENKLRFNDTPFEEVMRKISRRYNVVFEVRDRDLLDLRFTATFIDESIEDVMNMLQTVSPIKYRIIKRTTINDRNYLKPKIIVGKKWNFREQK